MDSNKKLDIAIIGSGPAGISAAIYGARAGFKTAVFGDVCSSRLFSAHKIENFFGFPEGIDGTQLIKRGAEQAKRLGAVLIQEEVIETEKKDEFFILKTSDNEFHVSALVFASGVRNQASGIAREQDFKGRGIAFCVTCDGAFFKDKRVAVIGEGDFAAEEALELLDFTKDIELFLNGKQSQISDTLKEKIKKNNIPLNEGKIKEFWGDKKLSGLLMADGDKRDFEGVFLAQGLSSSFKLAIGIGVLTKNDFIEIDENGQTNIEGVFAAGDVTGRGMQVSTAVGGGARAALSAISYIKRTRE